MRVASLRFSWSVHERPGAHWEPFSRAATDLWGWVHVSEHEIQTTKLSPDKTLQEDAVADAFLLAIDPDNKQWSGHEGTGTAQRVSNMDHDTVRQPFSSAHPSSPTRTWTRRICVRNTGQTYRSRKGRTSAARRDFSTAARRTDYSGGLIHSDVYWRDTKNTTRLSRRT